MNTACSPTTTTWLTVLLSFLAIGAGAALAAYRETVTVDGWRGALEVTARCLVFAGGTGLAVVFILVMAGRA